MKVKIPREIELLTHKYQISFNPKEMASTGCAGLTRHLYQKIYLDKTVTPPSELNQILFHEILHVIERQFSIKIDDADIDRLSQGLIAILTDCFGIELSWEDIEEE